MKIPNKKELKQTVFNHLSDIKFKEFINLYVKYTAKSFPFLVIDTIWYQIILHVSEIIFYKEHKS